MKMLGNRVAVERVKQEANLEDLGLFKTKPLVSDSYGVIKYAGELVQNVKIGDKVYFGNQKAPLRIAGEDLEIMDVSNIIFVET